MYHTRLRWNSYFILSEENRPILDKMEIGSYLLIKRNIQQKGANQVAKGDSNNWENESPQENEKLRDLVRDLAHAINTVFAESSEIKTVIKDIEQEGYTVDLVLASITRALKNKDQQPKNNPQIQPPALLESDKFELNRFDQSFLKSIKVKPEAEGEQI